MRFRIGESDLLCIDWDERSLRLVNASVSRSGVTVRSAVHVSLEGAVSVRDPSAFGEFIRRTLAEHRIRTRRVVVDVPRQDAALNLMSLPKGSLSELAAMVDIQIGKELPFSKDQAVVDFAIAQQDNGNKTNDVWVAAVRNNVVDHIQQVILAAGLRLERIGLRPYANLSAVTADGPVSGRALLVDIGPSMTEIDVIRDGRLVYSRAASVSIPTQGLSAPPTAQQAPAQRSNDATIPFADDFITRPSPMDALLVDVSRTIEAYRATDPGARIERIILSGTGVDENVAQAFANRFGSATQIFQAPAALKWKNPAGQSAAPFSAVMGLALSMLSDSMLYFNFIKPKQAEDERRERARRVPYIAAGVAVFFALASVAAYLPVRKKNQEIQSLKARIAEIKKDEKPRKELITQLGFVEDWQNRNIIWIDVLKRFTDEVMKTNKDAYLTKLDMNEAGKITMELAAVDENVATDLADAAEGIQDGNRPLVRATVGDWRENPKDQQYPVTDKVNLQIRKLIPETKKR